MIRFGLRKDYNFIAEYDLDFDPGLIGRDTHIQVVEREEHAIAYVMYTTKRSRIELIRIAVHPRYRREGYASMLFVKLLSIRDTVVCSVDVDNLDAQLWLKALGVRAVREDDKKRVIKFRHVDSRTAIYP